jgi:polyether ionophore transport system permease protein
MGPASGVLRRALRDSRTRTLSFALLFAFAAAGQAASYRGAYPTLEDRLKLARTFGDNQGTRLLYGIPHDLLTTGGWLSWRLGSLPVFAALWGLFGAVRALRAEEESGRQELVLSGIVGRRPAFLAAIGAVGIGAVVLWLALFLGILPGRVDTGGAAYLALALVTPGLVFAGVGALTSQLAPTRRGALGLGGGAIAVALVLRMVADTSHPLDWLRWLTPLGWAEELRPFVGAQPLVLVLPVLATAALLVASWRIACRRDVGAGLLRAHDSAPPRLAGLSSPAAQALRDQRGSLAAWLVGTSLIAVLLGALADTASGGISGSVDDQFRKIGASLESAKGFLGLEFLFLVLAICLFVCFQVAAAREEEAEERLETLLALPVGRRRWLGGRLAVAALASAAIALVAGLLAWVGAAASGAGVSLGDLLGAGANCLPVALLFLGIGALLYAVVPRASAGIAFGLVGVSFLWDTIGSLVDVPGWVVGLSPFDHVALVPAASFDATAAVVMLAIGAVAAVLALGLFDRRDLIGA